MNQAARIRGNVAEAGGRIAVLLSLHSSVERDGKELYEIPVAVTGEWVKGERRFSITPQDLGSMVHNFSKRENHQVVIDYEHASEQPEVAKGGPIPAAGWIHELSVGGWGGRKPASDLLYALVEWTPEARQMIHGGQYRFFSPAIDWSFRDKETGKLQGATLTSGALTNHPFLEELPPIVLTDFGIRAQEESSSGEGVQSALLADVSTGYLDGGSMGLEGKGESKMAKKLTLKKLTEGDHAGHHGVFDDDDMVGYLSDEDLKSYAKEHLGVNPDFDEFAQEKGSEALAERLGVTPGTTINQVRKLIEVAREAEERRSSNVAQRTLLADAVRDGRLDNDRAALLAREGKISLADYIAAQEAERALDRAMARGKLLPRDRKFFFRDALERPKEFNEFVDKAVPVVRLESQGIGSGEQIPVDQEIDLEVKRLMSEQKMSYGRALKQLLHENPALETRYREAHSRRIGPDAPASGARAGI